MAIPPGGDSESLRVGLREAGASPEEGHGSFDVLREERAKKEVEVAEEEEAVVGSFIFVLLGPALGLVLYLLVKFLIRPQGMEEPALRLIGATSWIGCWWMTEALPLGVTSLLPLALFPVLQLATSTEVVQHYSHPITWLFFGGFQLAFAIERAGLQKRMANGVLRTAGTKVAFLLLGFMLAVGILSMFLSNVSTTLMILPVATALVTSLETGDEKTDRNFWLAFMLGIAYSASLGGIGTLNGTAPNGVLSHTALTNHGIDITYTQWVGFAAPFSLLMIIAVWLYFILLFKIPFAPLPEDHPVFAQINEDLGPMSGAERWLSVIFASTVFAWVTRGFVNDWLDLPEGAWRDETISIWLVLVLFFVRAESKDGKSRPLMTWKSLLQTPWHLLFLFGGGFALGKAFSDTGLSQWIGEQFSSFDISRFWLLIAVAFTALFLTEITSNTATAGVILPILGRVAQASGIGPMYLLVPTTMAVSCAFMLPVATPPNAIVFATGKVALTDMAKVGLLLNLASLGVIILWTVTWGYLFWDYDGISMPPVSDNESCYNECTEICP